MERSTTSRAAGFPGRKLVRTAGCLVLICTSLFIAGCEKPVINYTEVRRIDELIAEEEMRGFLSVIKELPDQQLPPLASVWAAPPTWTSDRPIKHLVQMERQTLEETFSPATLVKSLPQTRSFQRALQEAHLTPEQFSGLILALAVAHLRSELPESQNLDAVLARGAPILRRMSQDERVFSALTDDGQHYVLQEAAWISLADRVERLKLVPELNIVLAKRHRDALLKILPEQLRANPLEPLWHLTNDSGLPFIELVESGTDAQLTWTPPKPTSTAALPEVAPLGSDVEAGSDAEVPDPDGPVVGETPAGE